jgi:2-oxoglutarate ferredoxin oxidoreductase subunit alpha
MARFTQVIVPEINRGQLAHLLRAETLRDVRTVSQLRGRPFKEAEMHDALARHLPAHEENRA